MINEAVTVPVRIEAATRKISAQWVRISATLMRQVDFGEALAVVVCHSTFSWTRLA
jgi:hypothetical protein